MAAYTSMILMVGGAMQGQKKTKEAAKKARKGAMYQTEQAKKKAQEEANQLAQQSEEQRDKRKRAIARNETTFTNPLGTAEEAEITKNTLLGE